MKKKDLLLIGALVLFAALLLGLVALQRARTGAGDQVLVYVDGKLHTTAPLQAGKALTITQDDGSVNVIRMTQGGFYMEYSTCRNQQCVQQGEVNGENFLRRVLGTHVICLPNRVDVVLQVQNAPENPDAPDV